MNLQTHLLQRMFNVQWYVVFISKGAVEVFCVISASISAFGEYYSPIMDFKRKISAISKFNV